MAGARFEEYPGKARCKMLIGVSGYIGSGKDEVAKMIQFLSLMGLSKRDFGVYQGETWKIHGEQDRHWKIKKFAAKLKEIVSLLTGIPVYDLEKESVKASELPKEWDYIAKAIQLESRHWITIPGPVVPTMEDRAHKRTVRQFLQLLGTEACRNVIHENIWVNALFADYKEIWKDPDPIPGNDYRITWRHRYEGATSLIHYGGGSEAEVPDTEIISPNWIISDCRFENEAKAIKDRDGIVVRINRPTHELEPDALTGKQLMSFPKHPSETSLDSWEFDYTIDNSGSLEELLEQVRTMLLHFKIIT